MIALNIKEIPSFTDHHIGIQAEEKKKKRKKRGRSSVSKYSSQGEKVQRRHVWRRLFPFVFSMGRKKEAIKKKKKYHECTYLPSYKGLPVSRINQERGKGSHLAQHHLWKRGGRKSKRVCH